MADTPTCFLFRLNGRAKEAIQHLRNTLSPFNEKVLILRRLQKVNLRRDTLGRKRGLAQLLNQRWEIIRGRLITNSAIRSSSNESQIRDVVCFTRREYTV
jgi:hypothetical protein